MSASEKAIVAWAALNPLSAGVPVGDLRRGLGGRGRHPGMLIAMGREDPAGRRTRPRTRPCPQPAARTPPAARRRPSSPQRVPWRRLASADLRQDLVDGPGEPDLELLLRLMPPIMAGSQGSRPANSWHQRSAAASSRAALFPADRGVMCPDAATRLRRRSLRQIATDPDVTSAGCIRASHGRVSRNAWACAWTAAANCR